jgi:hypothetical protein
MRADTDHGIPKSIAFKSLSFEISYEPTSPVLEEHDVSLARKLLMIGPRAGTRLRERRFYTASPTDAETHLELLMSLERQLVGATAT